MSQNVSIAQEDLMGKVTAQDLLFAAPRLQVQVTIMLLQAVLWYFAIPFLQKHVVEPYVERQPWAGQFRKMVVHSTKSKLGPSFPDKLAYQAGTHRLAIILQHLLGGLLCLPSILGLVDPQIGSVLAMHGALFEAGWELSDALDRFRKVCFGSQKEKQSQPTKILILVACHHLMGLTLVIPMNLYFGSLRSYHEGLFLLQGGSATAIFVQYLGYTFDIKTPLGLNKMRASVALAAAIIYYTRFFRYVPICLSVTTAIKVAGYTTMYQGACIACFSLGLVNLVFVQDITQKVNKFWFGKKATKKDL